MARKVIALILVATVLLFVGCGDRAPKQYDDRMKWEGGYVWTDTETGVCYLGAMGHYTVMVNADGTPFIANGWRDEGT